MSYRICDTRRRSLRNAEQARTAPTDSCRDNCFQILDPSRERKIADVPVSHSAATFIVTHEVKVITEEADPVAPDRALPLEFEMSHPVRGFDQRRACACLGPGELDSVRCAQITDSLCWPS